MSGKQKGQHSIAMQENHEISTPKSIVISLATRETNVKGSQLLQASKWILYAPAIRNGTSRMARIVLAKIPVGKSRSNRMVHTAASQFLAGAVGGTCATYSTHWLDTVKVRMQTNPSLHPSAMKCISNTLHEAGVRGLYQGALPAVTGHAVKASVVFMSYGICQETVRSVMPRRDDVDELSVPQLAAAGAMTGVLASFALCPLELVKCRMQANQSDARENESSGKQRKGPLRLALGIRKADGIRGLYRGLPGMWAKEVPGSFVYFGSYEMAKASMRTWLGQQAAASKKGIFGCGMVAGLCYCVTHPLESVKTRVQVETNGHGFFKGAYHIIKADGFKPLYRGMVPSMVRAALFSGIQFVIYEAIKDSLISKE